MSVLIGQKNSEQKQTATYKSATKKRKSIVRYLPDTCNSINFILHVLVFLLPKPYITCKTNCAIVFVTDVITVALAGELALFRIFVFKLSYGTRD